MIVIYLIFFFDNSVKNKLTKDFKIIIQKKNWKVNAKILITDLFKSINNKFENNKYNYKLNILYSKSYDYNGFYQRTNFNKVGKI